MRIGSSKATTTTQLIFLFLSWCFAGSANILKDVPKFNPLNIYYDPAPSAEDGPPLSRGAQRDPSYLPAEIGGIIGAYVFCVCVVGTALVLIGRRARQRAATARDVEMVAPNAPSYKLDISPLTPGGETPLTPGGHQNRNFSWPSPEKTDRNPYIFPASSAISIPGSPPGVINPYIDHRIVEADRHMMGRNLEDIYAHVMEQEDAKASGANVKELPPPPQLAGAGPVPLASPQRQGSPQKKFSRSLRRPSILTIDEPKSPKPHSRTSSIISSLKSPGRRKTIRGLQISSPMQTPLSATFPSNASDEEPLSPRFYRTPPPPPIPKDAAPYEGHQRNTSSGPSHSPTRSIAEQLSYDPLANTQSTYNNRSITHFQTHRPNPSQTSIRSNSTRGDPLSAISTTSQTPLFPLKTGLGSIPSPRPTRHQPLALQLPPVQTVPVATRALPFRSYENSAPSLASPAFSQTTKTTVLERTIPMTPGLNTAGMPRTPWTAGAVPYSPYQPFTPMVPVTPRLVTKEDRKEMKRKQKKAPVLEMIKGEDELWDAGY